MENLPQGQKIHSKRRRWLNTIFALLIIGVTGLIVYQYSRPAPLTVEEKIEHQVSFDASVDFAEQNIVKEAIKSHGLEINQSVTARVVTSESITNASLILQKYVPVTNIYSVRQKVTKSELLDINFLIDKDIDATAASAISKLLNPDSTVVSTADIDNGELMDADVAFIPVSSLSPSVKLLDYEGNYYLDEFNSGAIFREVVFSGEGAQSLSSLKINDFLDSSDLFKVNMTGVTALTRVMMRKLDTVQDPLYFSAKIGDFLSDADLTHVSNEVSFKPGCTYSNTLFCSPPEFIETLKASGVDLVELTGNHNNDLGSEYNTQTIELYKSLGWETVGGGLNTEEAAKPVISNVKGSTVAFLAYNYPDSPNGGAIAGENRAGANSFDFIKIEADITSAKQNSDFVIVNVQYWECYSYPDSYVEFPKCDKPIGEQELNFKKIVDLGADMVIGSSAHQPQTYETYKGKPIYYGLGNLYFDQTSWPGTERGIVLTHYFINGNLLQTKLTPTIFDKDLQTRIMTDKESAYFLQRLKTAR